MTNYAAKGLGIQLARAHAKKHGAVGYLDLIGRTKTGRRGFIDLIGARSSGRVGVSAGVSTTESELIDRRKRIDVWAHALDQDIRNNPRTGRDNFEGSWNDWLDDWTEFHDRETGFIDLVSDPARWFENIPLLGGDTKERRLADLKVKLDEFEGDLIGWYRAYRSKFGRTRSVGPIAPGFFDFVPEVPWWGWLLGLTSAGLVGVAGYNVYNSARVGLPVYRRLTKGAGEASLELADATPRAVHGAIRGGSKVAGYFA